jgi:hypothetical protein
MKQRPTRNRGLLVKTSFLSLISARVRDVPTIPFCFEIICGDGSKIFHFRSFGRHAKRDQLHRVQRGWLQALTLQIGLADENDLISIAEHIICDTEEARWKRRVGGRAGGVVVV